MTTSGGSSSSFGGQFVVGGGGGRGTAADEQSPSLFGGSAGNAAADPGGLGVLSETNLYIRGLSEDCTDEKLREMCAPYGKIVSTKAILDKATKKCRGYGFVDFDRPECAHAAIRGLTDQNTGVHAQMAKQQEQDPTNLYIANLPMDFDEDRLSELLQIHGMVISSRILRNPDGMSRGVGFCRMTTAEACASIIAEYHGRVLGAGCLPLIVKLADSSGSRKSKRSTPSLHSFYSGESHRPIGGGGGGYKHKMSATPLMTASLMDPLAFQAMSPHHLGGMQLSNGRFAASQYLSASHPYNAAAIPDLLSTQFQQMGLANGGAGALSELAGSGGGGQMMSNAPSVGAQQQQQQPGGGGTPTDLQQQFQQQQAAMVSQPQQQAVFYQPQPPTYYGPMPYYMPSAAAATGAAAPTGANAPYQQPLFLYPDYFTFALSQQSAALSGQQQATAAAMLAAAAAGQMPSSGAPVFHPQQQQQAPSFIPSYNPDGCLGSGTTGGQQQQSQQQQQHSAPMLVGQTSGGAGGRQQQLSAGGGGTGPVSILMNPGGQQDPSAPQQLLHHQMVVHSHSHPMQQQQQPQQLWSAGGQQQQPLVQQQPQQ